MVQYEIKVTGKVQGVGFRFFAQHRANQLGIKGWVKNIPGGVLVMALGEETDVETYIDHLQIGPPLARVEDVTINRMPNPDSFDEFRVKY